MINTPERTNLRNVGAPINDKNTIKLLGQFNSTQTGFRNKSNDNTITASAGTQMAMTIQQTNPNIISFQQPIPLVVSNKSVDQNSIHVQNVIQKNLNMLKQFQSETHQPSQTTPKLLFLEKQENRIPKNEDTVKKIRQSSLISDGFTSNSKISNGQKIIVEKQYTDNVLTLKNPNSISSNNQIGEIQQQLTNASNQSQNELKSSLNEQQFTLNSEKIFNALEIVGQNKEIANKVMLLTKEIERLRVITNENEEENKNLQEKIEVLQTNNHKLQETVKTLQSDSLERQKSLETSELRRSELHKAVENLQKQVLDSSKDKEQAQANQFQYELKLEEILKENEKVLQINNSLLKEKQNLQEEIAKQTLNLNHQRQQTDELAKELRLKNDVIRQLENDKVQWNQELRQVEINQLQQTIETEKLGVELLEIQNQNDQLQSMNKELSETLDSLRTQYDGLVNSKEVISNELNVTRETFLQIKSDLTNQVSRLQEENRESRLKGESLSLQNAQMNKQIQEFHLHIKELSKKIKDQEELIHKNQSQIGTLNMELQKERDSSKLEGQKLSNVQSQTMELAQVNEQLQLKVKEFQAQYQEQLLKIQQIEFTVQQKNQQIASYTEQLRENQILYNNLLKKNQEILKFNEDLQNNDSSKLVIEDLTKERNELMGKLNLLLTENENLIKANEKFDKQLKNKIEEIDIKKKLLLQFQKENENFRSQINNLPQADRVESLLDTQKSQNRILMQRLQEKEKENQLISSEMEQQRIKLIQYQQKEQLLHSEDAASIQTNHFKNQIQTLNVNNEKLQNENQQLYDLLKLRKQEIQLLTDKLEKKNLNAQQSNFQNNTLTTTQSNKSDI